MAERSRDRVFPVDLTVYDGARHGFDNQEVTTPRLDADVPRWRGGYNPMGSGATLAYHEGAHADAIARVQQFLASHLR